MKTPELGFSPKGLYIGGKWEESVKGKTFESINPANMDYLGELPLADEEDVNRAVIAAKEAFYDWSRMPIKERAWPSDARDSLLWAVSVLHGSSRKSQTRQSDIDSRRPTLDVHETIQKSSYAVYT